MTARKNSKPMFDDDPPSRDRLRAMIMALASGAELDEAMRTEIQRAIGRQIVEANAKLRRERRGRRVQESTWFAAAIAKYLIQHGGAKSAKDALLAAVESSRWQRELDPRGATPKEFAAVKKAYERLNKSDDGWVEVGSGGRFCVTEITQAWIDDAAARLCGGNGSGTTPDQAYGVLFYPVQQKTK